MKFILPCQVIFTIIFSVDKETIDYIENILRKGTITWKGRTECINRGRYRAKDTKGREVWFRDCDICSTAMKIADSLIEVDHIVRIGGFQGNWHKLIEDMYCGQDNLQALCHSCHLAKTSQENSKAAYQRKKPIG